MLGNYLERCSKRVFTVSELYGQGLYTECFLNRHYIVFNLWETYCTMCKGLQWHRTGSTGRFLSWPWRNFRCLTAETGNNNQLLKEQPIRAKWLSGWVYSEQSMKTPSAITTPKFNAMSALTGHPGKIPRSTASIISSQEHNAITLTAQPKWRPSKRNPFVPFWTNTITWSSDHRGIPGMPALVLVDAANSRMSDQFNGSSSVDSEHCTACSSALHDGTPKSITTPTALTVQGLAGRMQEWRAVRGVQGSNPPQTQSQSKGLFSLQSSSNLAQNPIPPTRGAQSALWSHTMQSSRRGMFANGGEHEAASTIERNFVREWYSL
jgi:hypothetical protein